MLQNPANRKLDLENQHYIVFVAKVLDLLLELICCCWPPRQLQNQIRIRTAHRRIPYKHRFWCNNPELWHWRPQQTPEGKIGSWDLISALKRFVGPIMVVLEESLSFIIRSDRHHAAFQWGCAKPEKTASASVQNYVTCKIMKNAKSSKMQYYVKCKMLQVQNY